MVVQADPRSKQLSIEGETERPEPSGCPISQQWHLAFVELYKQGHLHSLLVNAIHPDAPPPYYLDLDLPRRLPVVRVVSGKDAHGKDLRALVAEVVGLEAWTYACPWDWDLVALEGLGFGLSVALVALEGLVLVFALVLGWGCPYPFGV